MATTVGCRLGKLPGHTVLFARLRNVKSVSAVAGKVLALFPSSARPSINNAEQELLRRISSISSPTYLFFDNADDVLIEQQEPFLTFLQEILSSSQFVKVLCTSRQSLGFADSVIATSPIRIDPLDAKSSEELARKLLPSAQDSDILSITEACFGVPLAIWLVSKNVKEENGSMSPDSKGLLEELHAERVRSWDEAHQKFLFERCFEKCSPELRRRFIALSVFKGSFDVKAAAAVLPDLKRPTKDAPTALKELERKALISKVRGDSGSQFSIHPLFQSLGESMGSDGEMGDVFDKAKSCFISYYLSIFENLRERFQAGKSSWAFRSFIVDEQNIIQSLLEGLKNEQHFDSAASKLSQSEMFLTSIYWYNVTESLENIYDAAIKEAESRQKPSLYFQLRVSKAFLFITWGDGRSNRLLQEAQRLREEHPSLNARQERYTCYKVIDVVVRSRTCAEVEMAQLAHLVQNENYPSTDSLTKVLTRSVFQLCDAARSEQTKGKNSVMLVPSEIFMGEAAENEPAILLLVSLLNTVCEKLNIEHAKESMVTYVLNIREHLESTYGSQVYTHPLYINVNGTLQQLGEFNEAIGGWKKILNHLENKTSASETLQKADIYGKLGLTLLKQNDLRSALKSYSERVKMQENLLKDHKVTAESYCDLGVTQYCLADYEGARKSHIKASTMRQKLLGKHTDTARSYLNLGLTQYQLGDYQGARESLTKALTMQQKLLGEHTDTARSYSELGVTQYQLGDYQGARESHTKALTMQQQLLGEHIDTARSYHGLEVTQYQLGDYQGALESHMKVLTMHQKLFEKHTDTARSYDELRITQCKLADYEGARESHTKALTIRQKLLGEHTETARSFLDLGQTHYMQLGDYQGARESHTKALTMRQKLELGEHTDTAESYQELGKAQYQLPDYEGARKSHAKALTMRQNLLAEHPDTARSYENLGLAQNQLGDYHGARLSHIQALTMRQKLELGEHTDTG